MDSLVLCYLFVTFLPQSHRNIYPLLPQIEEKVAEQKGNIENKKYTGQYKNINLL